MAVDTDHLTTGQAAEYVGVSDETLRRWVEKGKVRHLRMPSGRLRFLRSDLDAMFEPIEATHTDGDAA